MEPTLNWPTDSSHSITTGVSSSRGNFEDTPSEADLAVSTESVMEEYSFLIAMEQENSRRREHLAAETAALDSMQRELEQRRYSMVQALEDEAVALPPSTPPVLPAVSAPVSSVGPAMPLPVRLEDRVMSLASTIPTDDDMYLTAAAAAAAASASTMHPAEPVVFSDTASSNWSAVGDEL